jgi:hypothetical protein
MNYDYSILTDYFPESVIEEFYASAIDPRLCLLNAEFLNGDKAISELLGEVKIHNNNGTLKKGYRDTYASIVEHGGTSYTGIDIERNCIASCTILCTVVIYAFASIYSGVEKAQAITVQSIS